MLCWAAFTATLGCMRPSGHGLDAPVPFFGVFLGRSRPSPHLSWEVVMRMWAAHLLLGPSPLLRLPTLPGTYRPFQSYSLIFLLDSYVPCSPTLCHQDPLQI